MADLFELSTKMIDSGEVHGSPNRITNELSELDDDIAIVESFSHSIALRTDDGLVCFDASHASTGPAVVSALRTWSAERVHSIVYTHGHVDHVGGSGAFAADAVSRGEPQPSIVGHAAVAERFRRYAFTNGYTVSINARQFGGVRGNYGMGGSDTEFLDPATLWPDVIIGDEHVLTFGDEVVELRHARGETDDHLWAWLPNRKWIFAGDFVTWVFPNAGNPQKVQRYPIEWAAALRDMIAHGPEVLAGAHGLPIRGSSRIVEVLDDLATALESLVEQTIAMMNNGATLDDIIHGVTLPARLLTRPYMRPVYDEPEFVIRNVWRQFGGWWDGIAAHLKPSPHADVARSIAELAGGAALVIHHAASTADAGDLRLACHLADFAAAAAPDDASVHGVRADIYERRRAAELSLMAKGVFRDAARHSRAIADGT
jgi:alkyl sulfatase BDS1-like metallo-beta-lactamase superfamily hydrolase